ncbi:MAG TPA: 2-dehydropantoate 2-reductase [Chthoniobacterales bacterium]|nr:2-dehydropantoate 2-reductase [Chthoniobacterales bacterium]
MKVAVIGAGAVGGYYGGRLAAAGNEVVFLARGKTLTALREGPLRVTSIEGDFEVGVHATDDPSTIGLVEAVLVAVKAWQLDDAAAAINKMGSPDSIVVPFQNGMEAPDNLAALIGPGRVTGGLCRIVAKTLRPGAIDHFWAEPSVSIGQLAPLKKPERLAQLRDAFLAANVRCDIPADIARAMWTKYLFITPWGSLGAVTGLPVGPIRSDPAGRARLIQALEELAAVADAKGCDLGGEAVTRTLAVLDGLPPDTTSSMQRDIMAGRPSELETQTGAVVRFGRELGVPTPVHEAIYSELLPKEHVTRKA